MWSWRLFFFKSPAGVISALFSSLFNFSVQLCVQNSPQEARNMLLQNPQLAYALLQAQVVMRIVDPEIALVIDAEHQIITPVKSSCEVGLTGIKKLYSCGPHLENAPPSNFSPASDFQRANRRSPTCQSTTCTDQCTSVTVTTSSKIAIC